MGHLLIYCSFFLLTDLSPSSPEQGSTIDNKYWVSARSEEAARKKAAEKFNVKEDKIVLTQDPDVLDTWCALVVAWRRRCDKESNLALTDSRSLVAPPFAGSAQAFSPSPSSTGPRSTPSWRSSTLVTCWRLVWHLCAWRKDVTCSFRPLLHLWFIFLLLSAGHDIIFFWVARMVMMCTYLTGKLPFKVRVEARPEHCETVDDQSRTLIFFF